MRLSLKSTLIVTGFLLYLVTPVSSSFAQKDRSNIYIYGGSGLNYTIAVVLTDPQGRRAGLLSVPPNMNVPEPIPGSVAEIPNSGVGYDAIDDHVTGERSPGTLFININMPVEGNYTLEVTGTALTTYRVGVDTDDKEGHSTRAKFKGVTDDGLKSIYQITYSATPGVPTTAVRLATFPSAKQDVNLAFQVNWIKNDGLRNSLLQKLQNADAANIRGDKKAAQNILNAFLNEVNAQTGKGLVTDAATMLQQDAQYLMSHL